MDGEKEKTGPKGPRKGPLTDQDWQAFDKLCALQCTTTEVASWFDCSVDSLERRVEEQFGRKFADVFGEKRAKGKISLRRKQWQRAVDDGNVTMLIWLGKQYLAQAEPKDLEVEVTKNDDGSLNVHKVMEPAERPKMIHNAASKPKKEK